MKKLTLTEDQLIQLIERTIKEQTVEDGKCIKGDCENGQGTMTYGSGDKYVGQWRNGMRNGQGTYTYGGPDDNGANYVGEWKDGLAHGQGALTRADGSVVEGIWEKDYCRCRTVHQYDVVK